MFFELLPPLSGTIVIHLRPPPVVTATSVRWDEYYKVGRNEIRSPLRYIPRWSRALGILLCSWAGCCLWCFRIKREQRVFGDPTAEQFNARICRYCRAKSITSKGDHADAAEKKSIYFLDFVRTELLCPPMNLPKILPKVSENLN